MVNFALTIFAPFQSTPPGWEATAPNKTRIFNRIGISIHASRVGGDSWRRRKSQPCCPISIHASRVGGDVGRTSSGAFRAHHFNPRLPGGRRPSRISRASAVRNFNPRLPGGRRRRDRTEIIHEGIFQSTPPGWEATLG